MLLGYYILIYCCEWTLQEHGINDTGNQICYKQLDFLCWQVQLPRQSAIQLTSSKL